MKVYYIGLFRNAQRPAVELCAQKDLSQWSRFTQGTYGEFMTAFSQTVAERTKPGERQDIEQDSADTNAETKGLGFTFHVYARTEGFAAIIISDKEYPSLPAHRALSKLVDEFLVKNADPNRTEGLQLPDLKAYMRTCEDPENLDSLTKIQRELDETKITLHKTLESVLERGEKLDQLVEKSGALSAQSQMFYRQAKRSNSCCVVM